MHQILQNDRFSASIRTGLERFPSSLQISLEVLHMEAAAKSLPSTGVGFTALLGYLFAQPLLGCESTCVLKPQQKLAEGDWTCLLYTSDAADE